MTTPKEQAQAILKERERAQNSLYEYCCYTDGNFVRAKHCEAACAKLDEVVRYIETGEGISRLILLLPPRHSKTTIASKKGSSYFLGRNPDKNVMLASYSASLAIDSSVAARDDIRFNTKFQNLFGKKAIKTFQIDDSGRKIPDEEYEKNETGSVEIREDSNKKDRWMTNHGGGLLAGGVGGPFTGRGAHLLTIDDPYANRQEAESATVRKTVWDWYTSTMYSRLEKNGAIVIIMQRWNEDDLVGRLLRLSDPKSDDYNPEADVWDVLKLPAFAEEDDPLGRKPGDALWPEKYNENALRRIKGNVDSVGGQYNWISQYQQKPTAPEGSIFKREWFHITDKKHQDFKIQIWDPAEKKGRENDYWACATGGPFSGGVLINEIFIAKMNAAEGQEEIRRRYYLHNDDRSPVTTVWIEETSSGVGLVPIMQASDDKLPIVGYKPKNDKIARANMITGHCAAGNVWLLKDMSTGSDGAWLKVFFDQMIAFPNGAHDDVVDVVVELVSKLVLQGHVAAGKRTEESRKLTRREEIERMGGRQRRGVIRQSPNISGSIF